MNQTCSIQSYPLDGNQTVVEFVVTSSLHLTTQQSSFRSKALLPLYSVEVDLQRKKTNLTTIYCSAVAVHALIGHGRLCVDVIEVAGNVTRIAWRLITESLFYPIGTVRILAH